MIRIANKDDIPRIVEIELFTNRYNFKNILSNDFLYKKITYDYHKNWLNMSFLDMENKKGIEHYVYVEDNLIKGYFSIGFPEDNRNCELINIRVDVPFQNNKIGTIIMDYIFKLAEKKGIDKIVLNVFEKNIIGIKLYEKFGFEIENKYYSEEYGNNILKYQRKM